MVPCTADSCVAVPVLWGFQLNHSTWRELETLYLSQGGGGIIVNMKKNNQPLILGIVVIGAVLVIALALIFTRDSDETTTETPAETNTTETDNNNQQPRPTPDPQPTPDPDPQPGILPVNWDSLTSQEKLDLNPYDCASIVEIRKTDGRCDDDVLLSQVRFESLVESDGYNPVAYFQADSWDRVYS